MSDHEKREKASHIWEREASDWYSESDWIWRRLFQEEPFFGSIYDPSCGRGNVVQAARDAGHNSWGSDMAPHTARNNPEPYEVFSYLDQQFLMQNLASNPPFNLCDPRDKSRCYVRKALRETDGKVALLLPTVWVNARSWLRETPLYRVWWLTPRPSMPPGHIVAAGVKPGSGTKDFAIYVWLKGFDGEPTMKWLHRDEGKN